MHQLTDRTDSADSLDHIQEGEAMGFAMHHRKLPVLVAGGREKGWGGMEAKYFPR